MTSKMILTLLTQTIVGVACTLAYSILMRVKLRHLPAIAVGTLLTFLVYQLFDFFGFNLFVSNMMGAAVAALYSEVMARILKAPVSIYSTPSIILLVPGGSLYYTMSSLMQGDYAAALTHGSATIKVAFGIAVGILTVSLGKNFFSRGKVS